MALKLRVCEKFTRFARLLSNPVKKAFRFMLVSVLLYAFSESITQLNCERTLVCLLSKVIKPLPSPLYVLHPKAQNVYLHLLKILLLMDVVILVSQRIKKFFNLHLVHTYTYPYSN